MSLQSPMSRIPVKSSRPDQQAGHHKRTISAPSKLEQMQIALQARLEKEKIEKLAKYKEERMINLYKEEQERNNRQISKYGYSNKGAAAAATNVGGVRQFFQGRRVEDGGSAGKGVRGKPPLPYQKNSAGRDRGNPLAPISYRSANESTDVGVLGGSGSPTGIRHSPKPFPNKSKLVQPRQRNRGYNTPNDSGNESSGYEDQNRFNNRAKNTQVMQKRRNFNQYQASSEEDVNSPVKKQSSFQQWKKERNNNNITAADKTYTVKKNKGGQNSRLPPPRSTALHNGYHSDGPTSDFQKWQMEQNKEREDRLRKYQEKNKPEDESPTSSPALYTQDNLPIVRRQKLKNMSQRRGSQPSTGRREYESSGGEEENYAPQSNRSNVSSKASSEVLDRNAQLESELKKKERELLAMIEKQQRELEGMKEQRAREEAEHDQEWLEGFVKTQKQQAKEEREEKRRAAELEQKRKLREAEEREHQRSRRSNLSEDHVPSPPPTSKPANTRPVPRKAAMVKRAKPAPVRKPPRPPADDEEPFFDTSNAADFYSNVAVTDPDAAPVNLNLTPCGLCGRKFAPERLAKHQVACEKAQAAAAKRKKFDATKMRVEGTEQAQYVKAAARKPEPKKKDNGDWRKKREEFINALRYAKKVTEIEKKGGNVADLPPPPRAENAHYKQCPYCERRFAPDTADRHIPKCKDIKARPGPAIKRRGR